MGDDSQSNTPNPCSKGSRKSAPKVKTGCITCKTRHVKCDETKPFCLRCTNTGRRCDGYKTEEVFKQKKPDISSSVRKAGLLALAPNLSSSSQNDNNHGVVVRRRHTTETPLMFINSHLGFRGTPLEHRGLDFFFRNTVPMLTNSVETGLWSTLIPRIAATEDSVLHAAIAVASVHEQQLTNFEQSEAGVSLSLIQYSKAIASLRKRLQSRESGSQEVAVLTCLLFVCLELMKHRTEGAVQHLNSGMHILLSSKIDLDLLVEPTTQGTTSEQISEEILSTFSRLTVQSAILGRETSGSALYKMIMPALDTTTCQPFKTIRQARDSLYDIAFVGIRPELISGNVPIIWAEQCPAFFADRRTNIQQIENWSQRLMLFMKEEFGSATPDDVHSLRVYQISSVVLLIWNKACLQWGQEEAFDEHLARFKRAISLTYTLHQASLARSYQSPSSTPPSPAPPSLSFTRDQSQKAFSLEMGPIYSLFFIATKCRHPLVRREAISLLQEIRPQQEGVWDARVLAAIAKRVVDIEECGSQNITADPSTWPRISRVNWIHINDTYDLDNKTQDVLFGWKPDSDMVLTTWKETIYY